MEPTICKAVCKNMVTAKHKYQTGNVQGQGSGFAPHSKSCCSVNAKSMWIESTYMWIRT